jgi:hypothetical protein
MNWEETKKYLAKGHYEAWLPEFANHDHITSLDDVYDEELFSDRTDWNVCYREDLDITVTNDYDKMSLRRLSNVIAKINREKGFWNKPMHIARRKMLIIGELTEGLEADRKDKQCLHNLTELFNPAFSVKEFEDKVKDTVGDEIGDAFIRLMDCIGNDPENYPVNIEEMECNSLHSLALYTKKSKEEALMMQKLPQLDFGVWLHNLTEAIIAEIYDEFIANLIAGCVFFDIDIANHIKYKLMYNVTRAYMHGKAY